MNNFYTDLALEAKNLATARHTALQGITHQTRIIGGFEITEIVIENRQGSLLLDKPCGKYTTIDLPSEISLEKGAKVIAQELGKLLPANCRNVLVIGLGNEAVTPDALGPKTVQYVAVTRHIKKDLPHLFSKEVLTSVSAIAPGVMGQTGVESAEIISSLIATVHPDAVITVDSLCARKTNRLAKTVQLTDTGLKPGSGIGNSRAELSKETLGVPVIAIGIPTVVSAATLAADTVELLTENEEQRNDLYHKILKKTDNNLFVTPKEIDTIIDDCAHLLGLAVNLALHKGKTAAEIEECLL